MGHCWPYVMPSDIPGDGLAPVCEVFTDCLLAGLEEEDADFVTDLGEARAECYTFCCKYQSRPGVGSCTLEWER